jgi:acetoin utilization deacetylase AcuC-like enzyme
MLILHDPNCAEYGSSMRPEQPARVTKSAAHLRAAHPGWSWQVPTAATDAAILQAHTPALLKRIGHGPDLDEDTPYFTGIAEHARRSAGAAIAAAEHALRERTPVFSLMRPPGHHATGDRAMGFCYLNQIAIAALHAHAHLNAERVAVWDFDAHHGNGTEAILHDYFVKAPTAKEKGALLFASVHQLPGYPETGARSFDNCQNWPVRPHTPRAEHMAALRASLGAVVAFQPDLVLVSAGFDAYARDPITAMTLETEDFATLGRWLREICPPGQKNGPVAAAVLEGGYSGDLPLLIDAFLSAWEN